MEPEQVFPYTPSIVYSSTVAAAAGGTSTARRRRSAFRSLPRWDRRVKTTLRICWKGGGESWWLVEARGKAGIFHGSMALEDVMARILNER